jgi:hypothetical protein
LIIKIFITSLFYKGNDYAQLNSLENLVKSYLLKTDVEYDSQSVMKLIKIERLDKEITTGFLFHMTMKSLFNILKIEKRDHTGKSLKIKGKSGIYQQYTNIFIEKNSKDSF